MLFRSTIAKLSIYFMSLFIADNCEAEIREDIKGSLVERSGIRG